MKYIVMTLSFLLVAQVGVAQKDWVREGVEDTEFVIEKERENTLPPANRNYEKISYSPKPANRSRLTYDLQTLDPYQVADVKIDVSPQAVRLPRSDVPLGNYARLGFGNYTTPYADIYLGSEKNEAYQYYAHYHHLSSRTGEVADENSGNARHRLHLGGTYFADNFAIEGKAAYRRDRYFFYGYDPNLIEINDNDSIRQVLNDFEIEGVIRSTDAESPLQFEVGAGYATISDDALTTERQFKIPAQIRYRLNEQSRLEASFAAYLMRRTDSSEINRNFISLQPRYFFNTDRFQVEIGLNTVYEDDTVSNTNNVHLYPHLEVGYRLFYDIVLFGGITGDMERTSYRQYIRENPFLAPEINLIHSNKQFALYGGIRGNLTPQLNVEAQVTYSTYENLYFYLNDLQDSTRFTVVYNDQSTRLFSLKAAAYYEVNERLRTSLQAEFLGYTFEDDVQEAAWHRPNFQAHLLGSYQLLEELSFTANLFLIDGIEALQVSDGTQVSLDPLFDLSLQADYWFSEKFSAFLSANNLTSNSYQRYLNYPVRGFNFLVGLTYAF
ncbi:MAG: hypothetical protein ACFB0B_09345 [Thermonemataceae bacterium]